MPSDLVQLVFVAFPSQAFTLANLEHLSNERVAGAERAPKTALFHTIRNGLRRFEPGAQGEHKISRGFLPTATYSAHWLADPQLGRAVYQFLAREREQMRYHMASLDAHAPYKSTPL